MQSRGMLDRWKKTKLNFFISNFITSDTAFSESNITLQRLCDGADTVLTGSVFTMTADIKKFFSS